MLFNDYAFLLVFLPAAIAIYRLADPHPGWRIGVLVLLSFVFYSYWNPPFIVLLVLSIAINWLAARVYLATRQSAIITAAIVANLAVLGFFKYVNFISDNLGLLLEQPLWHFNVALPLGISFFTFHHIMYLVDLRRGKAPEYSLGRYALYISFFPQAIAGPLARWSEVMHQFGREVYAPGWQRQFAIGCTFIVIGLIEKTWLGDPLGRLLDPIYAQARLGPVTDGNAWLALGFGFQVLFDFAGYSDIAIGVGLLFGVRLPYNFNAPMRSANLQDFWQRWHMTLMTFLRDYVFVPLSNVKIGRKHHRLVQHFSAMLLTMALCGLWHGASWTFVLWGSAARLRAGGRVAVAPLRPAAALAARLGADGLVRPPHLRDLPRRHARRRDEHLSRPGRAAGPGARRPRGADHRFGLVRLPAAGKSRHRGAIDRTAEGPHCRRARPVDGCYSGRARRPRHL